MVSPASTRELLYVAATRGRPANHLYVDTAYDPDPATGHDDPTNRRSVRDVLAGVLAHEGNDISAHDVLRRIQTAPDSSLRRPLDRLGWTDAMSVHRRRTVDYDPEAPDASHTGPSL
jgi:hypothetical protein